MSRFESANRLVEEPLEFTAGGRPKSVRNLLRHGKQIGKIAVKRAALPVSPATCRTWLRRIRTALNPKPQKPGPASGFGSAGRGQRYASADYCHHLALGDLLNQIVEQRIGHDLFN